MSAANTDALGRVIAGGDIPQASPT